MNLENKRILVTGGAKRVGRMFVEKFQSLGAKLLFTVINLKKRQSNYRNL